MADMLRARLERLGDLAKRVNAATDEAARIVQGVESYLSDTIHLGVGAAITIDLDEDRDEGNRSEKRLVYDRYGSKFRIFVLHDLDFQGVPDRQEKTLWANCPRDVKLLAFNCLPALLDELAERLEGTLEQVKLNSETIQSLLPPLKEKKAVKP